jgi:hypothetical protein
MAYSPEDLEIKRRSVAMLRPGTSVDLRLSLVREVALRVIDHAASLTRISMAEQFDEDEDQAVA